jgi:general secretion pathway protein B
MDSRPLPQRARFPLWAVALIALLAVNLAILAVVLMRNGTQAGAGGAAGGANLPTTAQVPPMTAQAPPATAAQGVPATSPATAAQGVPATSPATAVPGTPAAMTPGAASASAPAPTVPASGASDHFSPMDAAPPPVYAPEIPPTQDYPSSGSLRRAARAGSSGEGTPPRDARAPDPVLTDSDPADNEVLPSINEINVAGRPALSDLHLDVHVYATKPSDRFVYINMRKYREGATLAEGPVLERIRRDGVVLNYQGLRFVLPRQQ